MIVIHTVKIEFNLVNNFVSRFTRTLNSTVMAVGSYVDLWFCNTVVDSSVGHATVIIPNLDHILNL